MVTNTAVSSPPDSNPCTPSESNVESVALQYMSSLTQGGTATAFCNPDGSSGLGPVGTSEWLDAVVDQGGTGAGLPNVMALVSTEKSVSALEMERSMTAHMKLGVQGVTLLASAGDSGALGALFGPVGTTDYCPLGGCSSSSTLCGTLAVISAGPFSSGELLCLMPFGGGKCGDYDFEGELFQTFTIPECSVEWDEDMNFNLHIHSTCECVDLIPAPNQEVDQNRGYSLKGFNPKDWSVTQLQEISGSYESFPASSPYVTAVGATLFSSQGSENQAAGLLNGAQLTTGGGFSQQYQVPPYQSSMVKVCHIHPPFASEPIARVRKRSHRGVHDI